MCILICKIHSPIPTPLNTLICTPLATRFYLKQFLGSEFEKMINMELVFSPETGIRYQKETVYQSLKLEFLPSDLAM